MSKVYKVKEYLKGWDFSKVEENKKGEEVLILHMVLNNSFSTIDVKDTRTEVYRGPKEVTIDRLIEVQKEVLEKHQDFQYDKDIWKVKGFLIDLEEMIEEMIVHLRDNLKQIKKGEE